MTNNGTAMSESDFLELSSLSLVNRILGPDAAQHDSNLFKYFIESQSNSNQPILVGRWGTGKTTSLIYRCQELLTYMGAGAQNFFEDTNICMIEESDVDELIASDQVRLIKSSGIERKFIFERMWSMEIFRRVILILSWMRRENKDVLTGSHWDELNYDYMASNIPTNLLKSADLAGRIIKGIIGVSVGDDDLKISDFFSERRKKFVNLCILDLMKNNIPIPIICIEPIETPLSNIEGKGSLANDLVASLLNCWYKNFCDERNGNLVKVCLSIPWHRYDLSELRAPQKIQEFTETVLWEKKQLREMINSRLSWHMDQCPTRVFRDEELRDPWSTFFPEFVTNGSCTDPENAMEDSFDYVCRHSSLRARDFIRLTRAAIMQYSDNDRDSAWEFFDNGGSVNEESLKLGVSAQADSISKERLIEAQNKFSNFEFFIRDDYIDQVVRGMESSISQQLFSDYILNRTTDISGDTREEFINKLWESEIIGVSIELDERSEDYRYLVKRFFENSSSDLQNLENPISDGRCVQRVGFIFSFSAKGAKNYSKLIQDFPNCKVVVNPVFNEHFGVRVRERYPLGV